MIALNLKQMSLKWTNNQKIEYEIIHRKVSVPANNISPEILKNCNLDKINLTFANNSLLDQEKTTWRSLAKVQQAKIV